MNGPSINISRRKLLLGAGAVAISSLVGFRKLKEVWQRKKYFGEVSGANFARGHQLRDPKFPKPNKQKQTKTLIIGAGVSGLSAAYHLKKWDLDFDVIELDFKVGGNSSFDSNSSGSYPQGAHYLPIPNSDLIELKEFLQSIGVITNKDIERPEYNPEYLCHDLKDRLYLHGKWQEGLVPQKGLTDKDESEIEHFYKLMEQFKNSIGRDGKRAFTIPLKNSSDDPEFLELDKITMLEFMQKHGFQSNYLIWYVNYCCRDDYGAGLKEVSAWAGIHYFAARTEEEVLTWSNGNGFLLNGLYEKVAEHVQLNSILFNVEKKQSGLEASVYNFKTNESILYQVENIVYAAPLFSAKNIFKFPSFQNYIQDINKKYVPWMVANIQVKADYNWGNLELAWDNVNYHGTSLGYVNSKHQSLKQVNELLTITQYWDLMHEYGAKARLKALTTTHGEWCEKVISELELTHPNISDAIEKIDISLWGHAMVIPRTGFRTEAPFEMDEESIYFVHTDKNCVSIFEEAFYNGLLASQKIKEKSN